MYSIIQYKIQYDNNVERSDPKGLSLLVSALSSCRTGDSNSCPPDLESGALTPVPCWGTVPGCREVASGKWFCRHVSLPVTCQAVNVMQLCWGVGQVSLSVTCQVASVMQPDRLTWSCDHASHVLTTSRWGHHCRKTLTPRVIPLFVRAPSSCRTGDSKSFSSRSGVRRFH